MPKDCCKEMWNKIPDDEPVFIIRGKDRLASRTVRYWIEEARNFGVKAEKLARAEEHLMDILNFKKEHPERMKIPD